MPGQCVDFRLEKAFQRRGYWPCFSLEGLDIYLIRILHIPFPLTAIWGFAKIFFPSYPQQSGRTVNRDEFYTAFKHDIITSKLKPGELLKEKQIMEDYGIGRLPMREILVRLQQENLIKTIPRMGTVVTRLDIKQMRDIVELRLELECIVAKLAAERITDSQIAKLRELVERIHSCADGESDAAAEWDAQFHQLLYEAAGNAELTRIVSNQLQTMMRLWYYLKLWDKDFLRDADGAPNILKALEKRDPELAQQAMRVHINHSVSRAVTGKFDLA